MKVKVNNMVRLGVEFIIWKEDRRDIEQTPKRE